jgi:hypothetical protein
VTVQPLPRRADGTIDVLSILRESNDVVRDREPQARIPIDENARLWAMLIARDVDACAALLRGDPVDPSRLRPDWLQRAREFEFVRFDVSAIELLLPAERSQA